MALAAAAAARRRSWPRARADFCFFAACGVLGPLVLAAAVEARQWSWLGPALASSSSPRVGVLAPWRSLPLLLPVAGLGLGPRWLLLLRRILGSRPLGTCCRCCCLSPVLGWSRVSSCVFAAIGGLGPLLLAAAAATARSRPWLKPALASAASLQVGFCPRCSRFCFLPVVCSGYGRVQPSIKRKAALLAVALAAARFPSPVLAAAGYNPQSSGSWTRASAPASSPLLVGTSGPRAAGGARRGWGSWPLGARCRCCHCS